MTITMNAYLNFDGQTEAAMKFYAEALGGTVEIMRFGDAPMPTPPELKDRVVHAHLTSPTISLMASDTPPGMAVSPGKAVHLNVMFTDVAEQQRVWDLLSAGGTIDQPLIDTFFGRFGIFTDKFGMHWMFNMAPPPKAA